MFRQTRKLHPTLHALAFPLVAVLAFAAVAMPPAVDTENVAVVINDNRIDIPDTVTAGPTTFEVTNRGTERHSLAIAREGGEAEADLDAELGPGETATLEYDLKEGQYTVYCPMDEHKDTLSRRLTVVPGRVPTQ
jgi:plastocyanin